MRVFSCRKIFNYLYVLVSVSLVAGCVSYGMKAANIRQTMLDGEIGKALDTAKKEDTAEEEVLPSLNKGILYRMVRDYEESNRIFEVAKRHIDALYGVSLSEQVGAVAINDTMRSYTGDRYEQVLLHAFMAMNFIELGNLDAARVEVLQADVKMREWGEQPEEDPFVRYLSGMIFEALGEEDQALVAYRRAKEIYQSTLERQLTGVPETLKKDFLNTLAEEGLWDEFKQAKKSLGFTGYRYNKPDRRSGEVVVILANGLAPVRGENSITTFAKEVGNTVRISLPTYHKNPDRLYRARLEYGDRSVQLVTVENIDALARRALQDDIPGITARAIARAIVKHQTQGKAEEKGGALLGFLTTVTNLATERADTRSWTTLPQELQMARVRLPAGSHLIKIKMENRSGSVVDTLYEEVEVLPGKITFITRHWTSPHMDLQPVKSN